MIERGEEPFERIMGAVRGLGADQVFVLRAPFEPLPLYRVLGRQGFAHWAEVEAPGDWVVWFYRDPAAPTGSVAAPRRPSPPAASGAPPPARTVRLDVRGLEPPQPMVRVLELADALGPDEALEVLHDRRPIFLYPQLDERGLRHETEEPAPGVVRIVIRRGAPAA
jgi:uncharacterized protein (DUF2249 family)